jgi:hypothetical protein
MLNLHLEPARRCDCKLPQNWEGWKNEAKSR